MRFWTRQQWSDYYSKYQSLLPRLDLQGSRQNKRCQINEFRGMRSAVLARFLVQQVGQLAPGEYYVHVAEHGIWTPSENLHLYYVWRKSHHDYRTIDDAPIHLAQEFETADVVSIVQMALVFGWGITLAAQDSDLGIHINHDDTMWMTSSDPERVDRAFDALRPLQLDITLPGDTPPRAVP